MSATNKRPLAENIQKFSDLKQIALHKMQFFFVFETEFCLALCKVYLNVVKYKLINFRRNGFHSTSLYNGARAMAEKRACKGRLVCSRGTESSHSWKRNSLKLQ